MTPSPSPSASPSRTVTPATFVARPSAFLALRLELPSGCRQIGSSHIGDTDEYRIDCGMPRNASARDTLVPAFSAQGWSSCGSGLASGSWMKGDIMIVVSEAAEPSAGFRVSQGPKLSPCR